MRRDHKPFIIKKIQAWVNKTYIDRVIRPQFDHLGLMPGIAQPHTLKIFGHHINGGNYLHIVSSKDKPVSIATWTSKQHQGEIHIGHNCLVSPGVNLSSAESIVIEDNCMLAADVTVSDCDWHGIYNRTRPFRCSAPVHIKKNAWLGLRSIVCKGVTIGENSIIGAGAVVTEDIPDNVIAAGNPAKVVKKIDPSKRMITREFLFRKGDYYWQNQEEIDRYILKNNSFFGWLKSLFYPSKKD